MGNVAKWKANINGAAEAAEHGARLLVMSRRGSGDTRRTYAAEAAKWLTTAAKMASDAAEAFPTPKVATAPPKAKPAPKRAPAKKRAAKAKPKAKK